MERRKDNNKQETVTEGDADHEDLSWKNEDSCMWCFLTYSNSAKESNPG